MQKSNFLLDCINLPAVRLSRLFGLILGQRQGAFAGQGLVAVHDAGHGNAPGAGRRAAGACEMFAARGLTGARILLLMRPRILGFRFNPVSFWLAFRARLWWR